MLAGVLLMFGWRLRIHAASEQSRRTWNIVRFVALGYLILWLIVVGPTLIGVSSTGGDGTKVPHREPGCPLQHRLSTAIVRT